jgi:hypothetical protein
MHKTSKFIGMSLQPHSSDLLFSLPSFEAATLDMDVLLVLFVAAEARPPLVPPFLPPFFPAIDFLAFVLAGVFDLPLGMNEPIQYDS